MDADQDFAAFVAARGTKPVPVRLPAHRLPVRGRGPRPGLPGEGLPPVVSGERADAPYPYVRRLMVNTLVSTRRRPAVRAEVSWSSPPDGLVDSPEQAVLDHEHVWPFVAALPQRQRAVIVLRYYEDLSERRSPTSSAARSGTVKSHAHDAMAALRRGTAARADGGVVA